MDNASALKNSLTEKDAENGIRVLAASGLLIDDLTDMYRGTSSNVLVSLCKESVHDLGNLHARMTALAKAIYEDMDMTTFLFDIQQSEIVRVCDDNVITPLAEYADHVDESSARLMSSLRDMVGTESPIISDAALCYLEEAGRITRRLSSLTLSVRISNDNSEKDTTVASRKAKP